MSTSNKYKKGLYIFFGSIAFALGAIGVGVPGLPTTPLLLLSAFLLSRGSKKLHALLMRSRLGRRIDNYSRKGGMSKRDKAKALFLMWLMITLSTTVLIPNNTVKIVVLALGLIGSFVIIFVVKNVE